MTNLVNVDKSTSKNYLGVSSTAPEVRKDIIEHRVQEVSSKFTTLITSIILFKAVYSFNII